MTPFEKLHKFYGTHEKIAQVFGIKTQAITYWKKNGIPFSYAAEVEKVTKGKVTILDVIKG